MVDHFMVRGSALCFCPLGFFNCITGLRMLIDGGIYRVCRAMQTRPVTYTSIRLADRRRTYSRLSPLPVGDIPNNIAVAFLGFWLQEGLTADSAGSWLADLKLPQANTCTVVMRHVRGWQVAYRTTMIGLHYLLRECVLRSAERTMLELHPMIPPVRVCCTHNGTGRSRVCPNYLKSWTLQGMQPAGAS